MTASEFVSSTEFEHVTLNDDTEVKMSFTSKFSSYIHPVQYDSNLEDYNKLMSLFRGYPADLFTSPFLKLCASCETCLEKKRQMLVSIIRECDDFPYGLQTELRRVATRKGDPLCIKFADGIHVMLSVLEGEEMSC